MYRSRKTTKKLQPTMRKKQKEAKESLCPFCHLDDRKVHKDGQHVMVVDNMFPYEFWDLHRVKEHLLLFPKRHVVTLAELTDEEKVEAIQTMAEYEAAGYSVYWRTETNATRTVAHQHTHLIKVADDTTHLLLFSKKPYLTFRV